MQGRWDKTGRRRGSKGPVLNPELKRFKTVCKSTSFNSSGEEGGVGWERKREI